LARGQLRQSRYAAANVPVGAVRYFAVMPPSTGIVTPVT
jgi:hypothetical protein